MPIAFINGVILNFVHVPKTGGSTVEQYMEDKGRIALVQKDTMGWSRCTAQHIEARLITDLKLDGFADASFAVLRDPLDRLMSEYKYRAGLEASSTRPPGPLDALRRPLRRLRRRSTRTAPVRGRSFDAWVPAAIDAYGRDPYVNDNHLRPQAEFVGPSCRLFRFEDGLDAVLDWVDAVTATPPGDRGQRLKASGGRVPVSDGTRGLVREFYRDDYALMAGL